MDSILDHYYNKSLLRKAYEPMTKKKQKGIIIVTMILVKKVSSLIALHDNK